MYHLHTIVLLTTECQFLVVLDPHLGPTKHYLMLTRRAGSIPGTSTNYKCGLGLERGPPSLVRTIA